MAGVGGWGCLRPAHQRQQHLCRGMGVPRGAPNERRLGPPECRLPLSVGATSLYLSICKWFLTVGGFAAYRKIAPRSAALSADFLLSSSAPFTAGSSSLFQIPMSGRSNPGARRLWRGEVFGPIPRWFPLAVSFWHSTADTTGGSIDSRPWRELTQHCT